MQNINTARQTLLETINVGQILENFNPVSMQGSAFKKHLLEANNEQKLQTITGLTDMIFECNKARHIDAAAFQIAEQMSEHLSDNIKAKLIYCYESLQTSKSNSLLESLMTKIDSLIVLEDAEIVNSIRSGSLNSYKSISAVGFIIESVAIKSTNVSETATHEAYHPISYIEVNESGVAFIRFIDCKYLIH